MAYYRSFHLQMIFNSVLRVCARNSRPKKDEPKGYRVRDRILHQKKNLSNSIEQVVVVTSFITIFVCYYDFHAVKHRH